MAGVFGPYSTGYQSTAVTVNKGFDGSRALIGDGVWLTAGHVIYEWNRVSGSNPEIISYFTYAGKILDYRIIKKLIAML